MSATSTIRPTVFILEGSAAAKSVCGGRLYSTLRRRYLLLDTPNKLLKSDSNIIVKVTANVIGAHYLIRSFTCKMR